MCVHPHRRCRVAVVSWLSICLAVLLMCGTSREASAVTAEKFFTPPKKALARGAHGGIYPYGDQIALGLYSISGRSKAVPGTTNMARAADAGFNLAGPYYGDAWWDLTPVYAANNEGMKFTFQIRPPQGFRGLAVDERAAKLSTWSDAHLMESVRQQVLAVLNDPIANKTVTRWTLGMEEVRYWVPSEMRYLKLASRAIREAEASMGVAHRPMWMYEPNNRNSSALQKTGAYQDIVSKGVYMTHMRRGNERSGYAIWSYEQIADAAKKLKTVPQAVLQLSQDFTDPKTGTNPAEIRRVLRHDSYLGLVMGMKGFNVWSMTEQRPNLTTFNEQFEAYGSVANDLTGALNLQDVFLYGEARTDLKLKILSGIKSIPYTDPYGKKFNFDALHSLNAAVGLDRYLFLVNSSEQPMDVSISGLPSTYFMENLFTGTTTQMWTPTFRQRLDVLGVAALRLSQLPKLRLMTAMTMVPEPTFAAMLLICSYTCLAIRRRCRVTPSPFGRGRGEGALYPTHKRRSSRAPLPAHPYN
jgi:hypothetical protein